VPFALANQPDRQVLALEGTVTIRQAQDLAAALGDGLEDGWPLAVETGGLDDIDTCILQLLAALRKTVPGLSFVHPSEAFLTAVDRCGLRRELLRTQEGS
jgi:anti-anti-sigma regulatory factor